MAVAIHNPSSLDVHEFSIPVSKGKYKVSKYVNDRFEVLDYKMECHFDLDIDLKKVETCNLQLKTTIPSKEIQLIYVQKYTKDMVSKVPQNDRIERQDGSLNVTFDNSTSANELRFNLTDSKGNEE